MKFLSQVLSQASGSIGGITYSHNRFGQYQRTRVTPVNPATTQQQFVRNAFSFLATRWATELTQGQRDAWELYAENVPVTDKIGQSIILTGLNMYIRSNNIRQQVNNILGSSVVPIVDSGPTIFTLAETDPTAANTMTAPDVGSLVFDVNLGWAGEDDAFLILFVGTPQNPGINFFKGPYLIAAIIPGDATTPPTSPAVTQSMQTYTAGQRSFSYARITRADGRLSPLFRLASVIVS